MDPRMQQSSAQADPNFNPDANPFESIVSGFGQGMQQSAPMPQPGQEETGGFQSVPKGMEEAAAMGGMPQDPAEDQTQKGVNPGTSKFLLGAMQQLQNYVSESQDRDEIAIARSIMQLLVRLVDKDQQSQAQRLMEVQQPAQAPAGQPAQGGQPAGGAQGLQAMMAQMQAGQQG